MNDPPEITGEALLEPASIRESLALRRQEVNAELDAATNTRDQLRRLRADGFDDDEHDPDGVPLSSEIVRLAGIIDSATGRLADIDSASTDLEDGRYGICTVCGRRIPPERLAIRPTATHCVRCTH